MTNTEIADFLNKIADYLEINGDNHYRIRAYRRAANKIKSYPHNLAEMIDQNLDLTEIPFIGKTIAGQIRHIVDTKQLPIIHFGTYAKILQRSKREKFFRYNIAEKVVYFFTEHIKLLPNVINVICASYYRRKVDLVGNLDFIVHVTNSTTDIINIISQLEIVIKIEKITHDQCTLLLRSGWVVNIFTVTEKELPFMLLNKTGSTTHVNALIELAKNASLILTEKTLKIKNKKIYCSSEQHIYEQLKLQYIPPELRENRGEIAASKGHRLPELIKLSDIKGDLHAHTIATDGRDTLEKMALAAKDLGYEYLAITDHSKRLTITNGLDERRLFQQIKLIDKLNEKLSGIIILKSIEVDILEDGSLDFSNDVLKELDIRVCSLHSKFKLPEKQQTERIIRAMDNPYFNILGHPTGRLLTSRKPYPLNLEKIMQAAKERHCFLEVNGQPTRLDLNDSYCRMAKEMGIKLSIASDAHSVTGLQLMKYGINQARRGWIEKVDVINTLSLAQLKKIILK